MFFLVIIANASRKLYGTNGNFVIMPYHKVIWMNINFMDQ